MEKSWYLSTYVHEDQTTCVYAQVTMLMQLLFLNTWCIYMYIYGTLEYGVLCTKYAEGAKYTLEYILFQWIHSSHGT